jgi:hypothetical protein
MEIATSRTVVRTLGTIGWEANTMKTLQLPRNFAYDHILLRLTADISIITAAATAFVEGAFKLIKRIEIVANGSITVKSLDAASLAKLNQYLTGVANAQSAVPTAIGDNQSHNAALKIDFAIDRSVSSFDTLLNSMEYSTLDIRITWGDKDSMYSTSTNVTINSASLELTSKECKFERGGSMNKVSTHEIDITATSDALQYRFPVGNKYRGVLVKAEVDGNPSNDVITEIEFKSGTDVFVKASYDSLRDYNKMAYEQESVPDGYVFIDFAEDGLILTQSIDTQGMSDFTGSFKVIKGAGVHTLTLIPIEIIPLQRVA